MSNYFIIFKPKTEKDFRMYTNQVFITHKDGEEFALKSLGKKGTYKIIDFNKVNFDKYWK